MLNVEYKVDDKKKVLTITVDLSQRHGLSNSGNTVTIAGTQGNQKCGLGDVTFGLSVYTKEGLAKAQLDYAKERGYQSWEAYDNARKGKTVKGE
jgi:hypothetical protein